MNEKTIALFQNRDFMQRVLMMEPEEAQKEFENAGAEITVEDLKSMAKQINTAISNNGELDELSLDEVSGGMSRDMWHFCIGVAIGIAAYCIPW